MSSVKQESSSSSSSQWEADPSEALVNNVAASYAIVDGIEADDQLLPMRGRLAPEHAHSAPAVLSPSAAEQMTQEQHHSLPSTSALPDSGQPTALTANQHQHSVRQSCNSDVIQNPTSFSEASCISAGPQASLLSPTAAEGDQQMQSCGSVPGTDPCTAASGLVTTSNGSVPLEQTLCLLGDVDVAEQQRILCQIEQQNQCVKQYLSSKKRQMTLGCFVAAKRVK